jgi:hypothetical protein
MHTLTGNDAATLILSVRQHPRKAADMPEGRKHAASDLAYPPGVLRVL